MKQNCIFFLIYVGLDVKFKSLCGIWDPPRKVFLAVESLLLFITTIGKRIAN